MTENTPMPKVSRLEVITTGARRRWTDAEKLRIVAESSRGHRAVSATARRYGLSTSHLFHWRKQVRDGRLGSAQASFAAAVMVPEPSAGPAATGTGRMEISLGAARIVVDASVDASALARVIGVLARR
jgi:transposase